VIRDRCRRIESGLVFRHRGRCRRPGSTNALACVKVNLIIGRGGLIDEELMGDGASRHPASKG
jgi:hypothetical protein